MFKIMKRILIVVLIGLLLMSTVINIYSAEINKYTFKNPIGDGADPWVIKTNDRFWYCGVYENKIFLTNSDSLLSILKQEKYFVFIPPEDTTYSKNIWAPELHYLKGKWYIYFAADDGDNKNHRMFVLEGGSDPRNPIESPFVFKGQITDHSNKWAIDGTVFELQNNLYFVWSGWPGDENIEQCIYIAKMKDPLTIEGERIEISCPTEAWEKIGNPTVNEGPEVLVKNNIVHIIYSASGSWTDDYCLGRLSCYNGNVLSKDSWIKYGPVFSKTDDVFGPGHASFVEVSPNNWWIIYHAAKNKGAGWNRDVRIQPFFWNNDEPDFGVPFSPCKLLNY